LSESTSSSPAPDPHLWITILAGGAGTRFWPLSTRSRPKQLLPLAGRDPLILDTLTRARLIVPDSRIRILAGRHLVDPFQDTLGDVGTGVFMVEPEAKGTAPALTWAAWTLHREDPDAVMASLHADHNIRPGKAFAGLIRKAADLAWRTSDLFTVAVPPTRPETGYGYIEPGPALPGGEGAGAFRVQSFIEKPDVETAREYLEAGYRWNSGIFIWRVDAFLDEVRAVAPELGDLLPLLDAGEVEAFFEAAPSISVDKAVLERSGRVASVEADFHWDDVGAWESLRRTRSPDEGGNVTLGSVHLKESEDNIVMAEEGTVVLFGVEGLVVVRSGDIFLVAARDRTPDLKELLKDLPEELRDPEAS